MDKYVITITRQFGSMGRSIAKELSGLLNINFYDRDIVEEASKEMNLPLSVVNAQEEKAKTGLFYRTLPLGNGTSTIQDIIFNAQKEIILDIAEKESCIIVGRCSDYILRNFKNHISIHIYAPYDARFDNCVNLLNMTPHEAKKMIHSVDKAREAYHMKYAKHLPSDIKRNNLLIDSSLLGVSDTAKLIADVAKAKFKL